MFANALRPDGSFALASALGRYIPILTAQQPAVTSAYRACEIPEINVAAFAYFAASIFWRASIHNWRSTADGDVRLGPYNEEFRQYLAGQANFPDNAALFVCVRPQNSPINALVQYPTRMRRVEGVQVYAFTMPGIAFNLFIGKVMPGYVSRLCFVHGVGNPLLASEFFEEGLTMRAARAMADAK
jgi:hypothetical protein